MRTESDFVVLSLRTSLDSALIGSLEGFRNYLEEKSGFMGPTSKSSPAKNLFLNPFTPAFFKPPYTRLHFLPSLSSKQNKGKA